MHCGSGQHSAEMRKFYGAIAAYLATQYFSYLDPTFLYVPVESVAFTTNFDMELERALARVPELGGFHLAIPILAHTRAAPREVHVDWLLGTVPAGADPSAPRWEWFPLDKTNLAEELTGPLVVKLHGSPLHQLPQPTDDTFGGPAGPYVAFEHALCVSEVQYLRLIVLLDTMPEFLQFILSQDNRAFFFVGHSLDEWNIRLRMFDQLYPRRRQSPAARQLVAINPTFDVFRSSVLEALGVDRWEGSPLDLAETLDS
jgi:hypothetical protein